MKSLFSAALVGFIFFAGTAYAYDLPKIHSDKGATEKNSIGASDWRSADKFEEDIKLILAENENLPASSPKRINRDKNLVFVAFYKGNAYFLDRYSIDVVKNTPAKRSWRQHIFPISKNLSPKNAKRTFQSFCLKDGEFYNSLKKRNKISALNDEDDKKFLTECFKVGYYYAFKIDIF